VTVLLHELTTAALVAIVGMTAWAGPPRQGTLSLDMRPVELGDGARTIYVSRFEATEAEWRQCVRDRFCSHRPRSKHGSGGFPVTDINWFDANEFVAWASAASGTPVRLPSLAEWRYIARQFKRPDAPPLFADPRLAWAANYDNERQLPGKVEPAGAFSLSAEGIYDLDGNVWEWTSTCSSASLAGERCPAYVAAGDHEAIMSVFVRDPASGGCATGIPPANLGLRLVADTAPLPPR
jgi:formylglycine-generating enzyme required for sulfatase activity